MVGHVRSKILAAKAKQMLERMRVIHVLSRGVTEGNKDLFIEQTRDLSAARIAYEETICALEEVKVELDENYEPSLNAINDFAKLVDEIKVVLNRVAPPLPNHPPRMSMNATGVLGTGPPKVKLEPIKIMDFDGTPENWTPFFQQFSELIDRNEDYSDLQKVSYLVAHLKGSAKSIVSGIAPTEANYGVLFQTLQDRFEDKRALGHYYLDKILNVKPLTQESEKGLNTFLEEFVGAVSAVKKVGIGAEQLFDFFLVHIATKKLDGETMRQFDMTHRADPIPRFEDLVTFIRAQAKILARNKKPTSTPAPAKSANPKSTQAFLTQQASDSVGETSKPLMPTCPGCKVACSHSLDKCPAFLKLEPKSRFELVKRSKRCYRCLSKHFSKSCTSTVVCGTCQRSHNELLHYGKTSAASPPPPKPLGSQGSPASMTAATSSTSPCHSTVLLATAQVVVLDKSGRPVILRALLDNGSQSHFLRKECCEKLGLPLAKQNSVIRCLGKNSAPIEGQVSLSFRSRLRQDVKFSIDALVMEELTDGLPAVPVNLAELSHLMGLALADQTFNVPGPVDLLIGAQLWPQICGTNRVVGPPNTPFGLESSLGWLVMGSAPVSSCLVSRACFTATSEDPIDQLLERFWLLEEVPSVPVQSPEDEACELIFLKNVQRNEEGRFTVALPFRLSPDLLGDSFRGAVQRFLALERKFVRNPRLREDYTEVIRSHLKDGYLSLVPSCEMDGAEPAYYIPHHGVSKPDSPSTPLRVVMNASAPSTTGVSLNDLLHVGPKLQNSMVGVLLNFRLFPITLAADVRKMYLRILVREQDRNFQRIIWRFSSDEELRVYQMNTVVFGISASPYLALRVVKHLISLEGHKYPLAAASAARDTYIDDFLTSVPSVSEACALQRQMESLFSAGSFTLAKWASNSAEVLGTISDDLKSSEYLKFDSEPQLKVLGLEWDPTLDVFSVKVNRPGDTCTKRSISSAVARIFDPLGLLAPLTVSAKGFVKTLWALHLDWDHTPPEALVQQWGTFVEELPLLKNWSIPRHSFIASGCISYLVGFSDASQTAYGAVVYVVTRSTAGFADANLLFAKSRVAPVKTTSIPRLELCAAVMLSSMLRFVLNLYADRHQFDDVYAFTDSTVTLQWLTAPPSRWKVFVANRVSKIQQNSNIEWWYHVRGDTNPADCLSRGLSAKALLEHVMWFRGPSWLTDDPSGWPITDVRNIGAAVPASEERVVSLAATAPQPWILLPLLSRVSSYRKLIRATAHVLRALRLTRFRSGPLRSSELQEAENRWLVQIQRQYFPEIFEYLECPSKRAKKRLTGNQLIGRLDLFIENGLIRVGGRLNFSRIPYDQRHPLLLPKGGKFVEMLVDQYHTDNLHTGPHVILSLINLKFWILSARNLVRQRVHKCNLCFRAKPRHLSPKMAPLPAVRFQQCKAFLHTGVDYAGPFSISMVRKRGGSPLKAYVCLFICLSTKAVHLELASSLSTDCFLAAFRRFLSRRGPCQVLCSDQGTNFIGAKNKLNEMHTLTASQQYNSAVGAELAWKGIEWRLNPPSAPHFGGIWERNIQTFKSLLYKLINGKLLTYEEFNTVITQIEAVMNSRPLAVLSSDPNGPTALTPAHFLALGPTLDHLPNEDLSSVPENRLGHYQRVTQIVQSFWKRWHQEYLRTLQGRDKWTTEEPSISKGAVVLVLQENSPPLQWPLAVVEEICASPDGITRVAKIRTAKGQLIRPLVKLCPLPTQ